VEQRINEALGRAQAVATQASHDQQQELMGPLSEVLGSLVGMLER
jgi:hypothetical protein